MNYPKTIPSLHRNPRLSPNHTFDDSNASNDSDSDYSAPLQKFNPTNKRRNNNTVAAASHKKPTTKTVIKTVPTSPILSKTDSKRARKQAARAKEPTHYTSEHYEPIQRHLMHSEFPPNMKPTSIPVKKVYTPTKDKKNEMYEQRSKRGRESLVI
jgi:hypothetical protein